MRHPMGQTAESHQWR